MTSVFRVPLPLLLLLFLANLGSCDDTARRQYRLAQSPQQLPPNPITTFKEPNARQKINAVIQDNTHVNRAIPIPDKNIVRVLQYDVNHFVDLNQFTNNLERVRKDIETLKPSVIVLLEVPRYGMPLRMQLDSKLRSAGYKYHYFYGPEKSTMGNLIVSRVELENHQQKRLQGVNFVMSASFRVKNVRLFLVVATIFSRGEARLDQATKVAAFIDESMKADQVHSQFLILGNVDADALNNAVVPKTTPVRWRVKNCFDALNWKTPDFTGYSGDVRDYILCSQPAEDLLVGSYMFLTNGSTHFPLVADFYVKDAADDLVDIRYSVASFWFITGSISFILLVSAVGIYYWVRSKLYDF